MSHELTDQQKLFLAHLDASRMDDIADYVAQGRMHGSLNDHDLIEAWVAAMKARAGSAFKSGQPSDALSTLGYEMEIRQIQAPVDRVDDELSKLISNVMSSFEELRQSAPSAFEDATEQYGAKIMKSFSKPRSEN